MRYLIDGHNLIGQLKDLSLADPNDEAKLVLRLIQFAAGRSARITVIFDHGLPAGHSPLSQGPVEAVFAGSHTDADRVIRERIQREARPNELIVVSNDRAVTAAARARRIEVILSSDFAEQMGRAAAPTPRRKPRPPEGRLLSEAEVNDWLDIFTAKKGKP